MALWGGPSIFILFFFMSPPPLLSDVIYTHTTVIVVFFETVCLQKDVIHYVQTFSVLSTIAIYHSNTSCFIVPYIYRIFFSRPLATVHFILKTKDFYVENIVIKKKFRIFWMTDKRQLINFRWVFFSLEKVLSVSIIMFMPYIFFVVLAIFFFKMNIKNPLLSASVKYSSPRKFKDNIYV